MKTDACEYYCMIPKDAEDVIQPIKPITRNEFREESSQLRGEFSSLIFPPVVLLRGCVPLRYFDVEQFTVTGL